MRKTLALLGCLFLCANAAANGKKTAAPAPSFRQTFAKQVVVRTNAPVVTTTTAAPGQAGYVHYFLIKRPDDSLETQVGIELADQRIAWSFPELGVAVSPFIESGPLPVNGKLYEVQHLYGIRPFPDDKSMHVLQQEVARRVSPWVDDETPHCDLRPLGGDLCMSCLGFVMRILFPGSTPGYPALPSDFRRVGPDAYYTTEDLLMYLAGLHGIPTREARLKRINALSLPGSLREDLVQLVSATDPTDEIGAAGASAPRSITGKARSRVRSVSKTRQQTPRPSKNL